VEEVENDYRTTPALKPRVFTPQAFSIAMPIPAAHPARRNRANHRGPWPLLLPFFFRGEAAVLLFFRGEAAGF
jgi:hypothetical protein